MVFWSKSTAKGQSLAWFPQVQVKPEASSDSR